MTAEQCEASATSINHFVDCLENSKKGISLVQGCAGTGKTVLAISMINAIVNAKNIDESSLNAEQLTDENVKALLRLKHWIIHNHDIKVGFVFPMTGIRNVVAEVFKESGSGLSKKMVKNPYEIKNEHFDILFVDESHRLAVRKNLTRYPTFDNCCNYYGLDKSKASQLDFVLHQSNYTVLFFDKEQSIKGSDIPYKKFMETIYFSKRNLLEQTLTSQMRCKGGGEYIQYVKDIFNCKNPNFKDISNYEFLLFDDEKKMIDKIQKLDEKEGLSKTLAGFSWKWKTSSNSKRIPDNMDKYNELVKNGKYDIEINGRHYIWNLMTVNWILRQDSKYTIGCIHTSQGFDLNYCGVIFGREIDYDPNKNEIVIDKTKFYDSNVKKGVGDATLKQYIINTYATILARGIKGCYVYAVNKNLRNYLEKFIKKAN